MAESDPISDGSVSSKRRKLNNGASQQRSWDSENDSGSDLFEGHHTIATQPLNTRPTERGYLQSQRAGEASNLNDTLTYRTQYDFDALPRKNASGQGATVSNGLHNGLRASSQLTSYKTQPTQLILDQHESQTDAVQVLRSSPPLYKPSPIQSSIRPKGLAIAPRGTAFRPPTAAPVRENKPAPPLDYESEPDPPIDISSDDDRTPATSLMRPTQFTRGGRGLESSPNRLVQQSSQVTNGAASTFSDLIKPFKHRESEGGRVVLEPHKQEPINDVEHIEDASLRRVVDRIRSVLSDRYPVSWCLFAIHKCGRDLQACMTYLIEQNEKKLAAQGGVDELAPTPYKNASRGVARAAEEDVAPLPTRASTKQTVQSSKTIAQKFGAAARKPPVPALSSGGDSGSDTKHKARRLMRGRRATTPSPDRSANASERRPRVVAKRAIHSDDSEEEKEAKEEIPRTMEQRLIKFFNTCTAQEMIDLSGQSQELVDAIIAARPFRSVAQIENTPHPTKPRAKPIGERTVEVCRDMMKGYDATAQLVDECERLAAPIQARLKHWKIEKQENGEMSLAEVQDDKMLPQPSNMSSEITLMPHQIVGLNWLHMLWDMRTSCILADDMGLGKTCQIISFLAQLQLERVHGPHLVVVPASTLENWLREFERFAPSLSVLPYAGSVQERHDAREQLRAEEVDVIITTYHYATNDHDFFRKELEPVVCVYDEAHQLRNPKTKKYMQTMAISRKSEFRVLLTGTPLQNNLQELVAILAFIMPTMFKANREELELIFKHNAGRLMDDHASLLSARRIAKARSMITPFILRRRKAQVIALPAKTRRVEYCDMTKSQIQAYDDVRKELLEARASGKKSTKVGNALMDMRKISIHPLLMRRHYTDKILDKIATKLEKIDYFDGSGDHAFIVRFLNGEYHAGLDGNDYSIHRFCLETPELNKFTLDEEALLDSGKVSKLKELLKRSVEDGDKVLLFSQFVIMLNILEPVMDILGIKYMRLDGSTDTNARQDLIDHYNSSPETTLFMLSTKAGGAGINLASANKVIIFDSGFNPQDDIQAENRAHRVGQSREVEVVRLVTSGTVEEQLLALGESKLALDERVAGDVAEDAAAEKANAKKLEDMVLNDLNVEDIKHEAENGRSGVEQPSAKSNVEQQDPKAVVGQQDLKDVVGQQDSQDVVEQQDLKDVVEQQDLKDVVEQQDLKDVFVNELRKTGIKVG